MESPTSMTDMGELLDDDDEFLNMIDSIEDKNDSPRTPHHSSKRRRPSDNFPRVDRTAGQTSGSVSGVKGGQHYADRDTLQRQTSNHPSVASASSLPTFDDDSPAQQRSHPRGESNQQVHQHAQSSGRHRSAASPPLSASAQNTDGSAKRRFPGPAGILPRLISSEQLAGGKEGGKRTVVL